MICKFKKMYNKVLANAGRKYFLLRVDKMF